MSGPSSEASARWGWWAAAVGWMAVIFCASLAALSGDHTRHVLIELFRRLHWGLSYAAENRVNLVLRKLGHLTEYAVLGALFDAALRRTLPRFGRRWLAPALAFGLAVAYAAGDEYHQSFVPGRVSSRQDVWLDAAGALLGLALAWSWRRRSKE